jgi:hypothetical protein
LGSEVFWYSSVTMCYKFAEQDQCMLEIIR